MLDYKGPGKGNPFRKAHSVIDYDKPQGRSGDRPRHRVLPLPPLIDTLTPEEKDTLTLAETLLDEDVAVILGVSSATVRRRVHSARKKWRELKCQSHS